MQPVRIHESHCMVEGMTQNLPIMRRACVALIVLASLFFMPWHKIDMQRSLVIYHRISQLSPVFFDMHGRLVYRPRVVQGVYDTVYERKKLMITDQVYDIRFPESRK